MKIVFSFGSSICRAYRVRKKNHQNFYQPGIYRFWGLGLGFEIASLGVYRFHMKALRGTNARVAQQRATTTVQGLGFLKASCRVYRVVYRV